MISVPGVPGRHVTFLVSPRKVTQRRRPGIRALRLRLRVPCASHLKRRLRNSHQSCGLLLRQSSPTSPFQPAMLGAPHGSPSVVAQTVTGLVCDEFGWLQGAWVQGCSHACKPIPTRLAGMVVDRTSVRRGADPGVLPDCRHQDFKQGATTSWKAGRPTR